MWRNLLKELKLSESYLSMGIGLLVIVIIGIIILNYFSGRKPGTVSEQAESITPAGEEGAQTGQKKSIEELKESLPVKYTVEQGESLWMISEKFYDSGYNWVDIAKENNLKYPDLVTTDETLTIPKVEPKLLAKTSGESIKQQVPAENAITGDSYTVVKGDNLWKIAVRAYGDGYSWVKIAKTNNLANPSLIFSDNVLVIPR